MSYSTSRDGFKRWEDLKNELGLSNTRPEYEDPAECEHPRAWRMGTGDCGGAQDYEACLRCGQALPESEWVMWDE